jgi:uncharacterized protein YlxW (UPF0749 family)
MTDEHHDTGTGWPEPARRPHPEPEAAEPEAPTAEPEPEAPAAESDAPAPEPEPDAPAAEADAPAARRRRMSWAGAMVGVLLALAGFALVVQLRSNTTDPALASARQEDLVRILSDLAAQEERLRSDIAGLQDSQRQLTSGAQGRQAALDEATRRADELGILAGTLPARGPGLEIEFASGAQPIKAVDLLDAVQELRGAGAEAMQITGVDRTAVRIVASTSFLDSDGGVTVDGRRLSGPYTIIAIGDPKTMRTALNIPGGVVESVGKDGGNVLVQEPGTLDVTALHDPIKLEYAKPVS